MIFYGCYRLSTQPHFIQFCPLGQQQNLAFHFKTSDSHQNLHPHFIHTKQHRNDLKKIPKLSFTSANSSNNRFMKKTQNGEKTNQVYKIDTDLSIFHKEIGFWLNDEYALQTVRVCFAVLLYNIQSKRAMSWLLKLCCDSEAPSPTPKRRPQIKTTARTDSPPTPNPSALRLPTPTLVKRDSSSLCEPSRVAKQNRYEGQEMNNVPHGNGSMLYANGDFYRGEWVSGRKEGRGLQIYQELNVQYEGEWQNDQPSGSGKLTEANASFYVGEFRGGVKHGRGQYFNSETKKQFNQLYQNGQLKEQHEIILTKSKEEQLQFPTLALDKERFTTEDLNQFEANHPSIRQLDVMFLLRYYGLCKLTQSECILRAVKEWSIKEVLAFLDAIELKGCKEGFYQNKIKGKDVLTLTQKELKEDLRMKMGDRKRFLNYRRFLTSLQDNPPSRDEKTRKRKQSPQSYKFRSATSMRKVLRNVKNYALYEESIQEEPSESDKESDGGFRTNHLYKEEPEYPSKGREYDSAAVEVHSPLRSPAKQSSLEKLIDPQSERSHSSLNSPHHDMPRKDSQESGKEPNLLRSISNKPAAEPKPHSEKSETGGEEGDRSSSSESSTEAPDKLRRKQTHQKLSHHQSEIRELYEFLKEHRSLQFLIREKDIEKLELIGQGGFGKVYKGKYVGQLIAIKDYLKTGKHRHKEDFMKELEVISDLKHPNIVLYMGMCITASKYTLITEYLENGSLFDQLHKKKKHFNGQEQAEILFAIVKGMVYLHNMKKILHRDLKSSNVLIGEDWQVKLCDFGLSGQKTSSHKKKNHRLGTFQWMAPEVIRNDPKIDEFADVYSFGVIAWELLSERIPYEGLSEQQIIGLVGYDNDHYLETPRAGPDFLKTTMRKCLQRTPNARPTFIQIQNDFEEYYAAERERMA